MPQNPIATCLVLLIAFGWLLPGCGQQVRLDKELSADDIMASVKRVYRECSTYQDQGVQTEEHELPESENRVKNTFRLRYDRQSKEFAFAYVLLDRSYVVKQSSTGIQTIDSDDDQPEQANSLLSALHIGNGVSCGTATLIPCLLKPTEVNQSSFWGYVQKLRRVDDEVVAGVPHYRLQGEYFGKDGKVDFWIRQDFSIQKIITREPSMDELVRIWDFNAQLNATLPSDAFSTEALAANDEVGPAKDRTNDDAYDPQSIEGLLHTATTAEGAAHDAAVTAIRERATESLPALFQTYLETRPYMTEVGSHPQGIPMMLYEILHGDSIDESPWNATAQEAIALRLSALLSDPLSWRRLQAAFDLSCGSIPASPDIQKKVTDTLGELLDSKVRYQRRQALLILSTAIDRWPAEFESLVPRLTELASEEYYAVKCLGDLGNTAQSALPTLKQLLASTNDESRRELYEEAIADIQK